MGSGRLSSRPEMVHLTKPPSGHLQCTTDMYLSHGELGGEIFPRSSSAVYPTLTATSLFILPNDLHSIQSNPIQSNPIQVQSKWLTSSTPTTSTSPLPLHILLESSTAKFMALTPTTGASSGGQVLWSVRRRVFRPPAATVSITIAFR